MLFLEQQGTGRVSQTPCRGLVNPSGLPAAPYRLVSHPPHLGVETFKLLLRKYPKNVSKVAPPHRPTKIGQMISRAKPVYAPYPGWWSIVDLSASVYKLVCIAVPLLGWWGGASAEQDHKHKINTLMFSAKQNKTVEQIWGRNRCFLKMGRLEILEGPFKNNGILDSLTHFLFLSLPLTMHKCMLERETQREREGRDRRETSKRRAEREREKERETETETETQTESESQRERERDREIDRERDTERASESERETGRQDERRAKMREGKN